MRFFSKQKDYDQILRIFQAMQNSADDFVPEERDLNETIIPNLTNSNKENQSARYILFLLWIINTGYETEENAKMRKKIKEIVDEYLEVQ